MKYKIHWFFAYTVMFSVCEFFIEMISVIFFVQLQVNKTFFKSVSAKATCDDSIMT